MKHIFSKQNRALLSELVRTDFKLRYQGSVLGYAWSLLKPLLLFLILYVVFVKFIPLGKGVPHYPVYLLLGIIMWNFFTEMTTQSLGSMVGRGALIRSVRLPLWIIVVSTSLSAFINFGLNLVVLTVLMVLNHVSFLGTSVFFPLVVVEVYLVALGLSLFLSAGFVKFRDIDYIWEVLMQAFFYFIPIIYPLSRIPNLTLQKLILLNPMSQAIQDARYAVITHKSTTIYQLFDGGWYEYIPFALVVIVFISGLFYFRKESKYFAENI